MNVIERLKEFEDRDYAAFQAKLTPGIDKESFIGVRVPNIRKIAKELMKDPEKDAFLNDLPHRYYDENMLHSALLSLYSDYDKAIEEVEKFLPYVDNWAVCDTLSPKAFRKNKDRLIDKIREWSKSKDTYTCRFGIEMLMSHYLDGDFRKEYLEMPADIHLDEYYVNMMIAWYYATALAKKWDETIPYLEERRLDVWVHNKTIQKAIESYRITDEQKTYLKSLKIR